MAREGRVIVKILKDVCAPIPYLGHSHERSVVHLLNPCSDVNRKDIQCNTFSFDYYEEGDNLVFKVKDNATIVGYNVSKEFTVVYWSSQDNNFVHTQGDGNGGNFNRSNFFVKEGDYYVGKVNKDWFLRTFDLKEIAIRVAYFDLDNHEEELIYCYSEIRKSSSFTPKKRFVKCSPGLKVDEQLFVATYNYHLTMSLNDHYTMFRPGEEVKYYLRYAIDDVDQGEELVYTHTTGGLVPDKEKDISVIASTKKVYFKFRVEYPPGYGIGLPPNETECYAEQTKITPNGNSKPIVNCNPTITFSKVRAGRNFTYNLSLQPNATIPANSVTKHYLSYSVNGNWVQEELVYTNTIGGTLDQIQRSINTEVHDSSANVDIKYRIEYPQNVKTNSGNGECSVTISDSITYSAEEDCSCEKPRLEIDTTSKKATFTTNIYISSVYLNTHQPTIYKSDDGVNWEKETETYNELSNYVFEFNLSEPIKKFYKAEVSIVENGRAVRTCSAIYESNQQSKPFVKCSPFLEIKNKQHQPTGWSLDVLLQPRATVPANTTTKYFFDYSINGVWQGEELVETNTTGGLLPDITKNLFVSQDNVLATVKFRIELPPEVDTGGDRTCYFETSEELKDKNLPDLICANPHLTVNSDNTARFVCALVENKHGNYTKEPALYWSDDEATYTLDANSSLSIEESPNVYKFNLSSPTHKFYKAVLTVKENGVIKHTCEAVARSNNKPTIHCNPTMTYEKAESGSGFVYHLILNPNDTFTNFIAGKNIVYSVRSYFDGVAQAENFVYTHNTGGILPVKHYLVYMYDKTVKNIKIEFKIQYPDDYEVEGDCKYAIEDTVWPQNIEDSFNCDGATYSGSAFNCDQTYQTGLSDYANIIKDNYEVTPKVYYTPDGGASWLEYEEGSQSLNGGFDTGYVYSGCIQKKQGILRYKFGVELKNKKTGVISDKKCYVEFMLEDTVQEQSHCYSITISEREANEEVKYKGDIYINMYRGYDVLPTYKIKTYYRYYDETDYKELSETTLDMTTYTDNTVAYTAFVQNPRDKYYLKAELIRTDFDYVICSTEENLIRKE